MSPEKPTANRKSSSSSRNSRYPFIDSSRGGLYIVLRVQPRSSKNQIDGVYGGVLKIRLTAPPVEGEANRATIELLSKMLGIKKSSLSIESGLRSRGKRVRVGDIDLERLEGAFSEFFLRKD